MTVIGIGNIAMGDDGIGVEIAEILSRTPPRPGWPEGFEVINAAEDPVLAGACVVEGKDVLLVDAVAIDLPLPQQSLIKGDARCHAIAAASIIAKVSRDHFMCRLAKKYPVYGFDAHKGYGTKVHYKALKKHGPSDMHRKTFL